MQTEERGSIRSYNMNYTFHIVRELMFSIIVCVRQMTILYCFVSHNKSTSLQIPSEPMQLALH